MLLVSYLYNISDLPIDTPPGDRADNERCNNYLLRSMGLHSAIALNRCRTEKEKNKGGWAAIKDGSSAYQARRGAVQDRKEARESQPTTRSGKVSPLRADMLRDSGVCACHGAEFETDGEVADQGALHRTGETNDFCLASTRFGTAGAKAISTSLALDPFCPRGIL